MTFFCSYDKLLSLLNFSQIAFFNSGIPLEGVYFVKPISKALLADFTIKSGEFVAIMGPSGSGKSTCMNIIGALDTPTSGTYELYGRDVTGLTPDELATVRNEHIGFVFQQFNLLPKRSVLDNVMLPLMYRGWAMDDRITRAREMLKRVGLANFESYLPTQLSGGMKQRVAIARALAGSPKLILADEPTGNLDPETGKGLVDLLHNICKSEDTAIVMATHNLTLLETHPANVWTIDSNQITCQSVSTSTNATENCSNTVEVEK